MAKKLSWSGIIRLAGITVAVLGIISLVVAAYIQRDTPQEFVQSVLTNIGTELLGLAITVLIVDALYKRLQEDQIKRQLIRDMGAADNAVALRAVQELKANGWLTDGTLVGVDLTQANLQGVRLIKANLKGVRLCGANLRESILIAVNMQGADLRSVDFEKAGIAGCNFRDTDLWAAEFKESELRKVDFITSHLVGVDFTDAKIMGCHFQDARFGLSTHWPDGFDPREAGAIDKGNWVGSLFEAVEDEMLRIVEGDQELLHLINDE